MSLRASELAKKLGVTRKTVSKWARQPGRIPCARFTKGGEVQFDERDELWDWIRDYRSAKDKFTLAKLSLKMELKRMAEIRKRKAAKASNSQASGLPPSLRAIDLFSRAMKLIETHPADRVLPEDSKETLRNVLWPLADRLWPKLLPKPEALRS